MDIEFLVHDIHTGTRPQWKLASNLEEASKAFQLVLAQDRKAAGLEEPEHEPEDQDDDSSAASSGDEICDDDADETVASDDGEGVDDDAEDHEQQSSLEDSDDEAIVVTRPEEEIDPEEDADFEREYAKMMSDSLESRKLERRPMFDVALPVRSRARGATAGSDQIDGSPVAPTPKMAFSVLTKKGNKQQVRKNMPALRSILTMPQTRTLELPTDSHFAVAMRNQQQAEREEQQRIKNLVLEYDFRENDDQDGKVPHIETHKTGTWPDTRHSSRTQTHLAPLQPPSRESEQGTAPARQETPV